MSLFSSLARSKLLALATARPSVRFFRRPLDLDGEMETERIGTDDSIHEQKEETPIEEGYTGLAEKSINKAECDEYIPIF